jgi:hypothetical protein
MYAADRSLKPYAPDATADRLNTCIDQMRLPVEELRVAEVVAPASANRLHRLEAAIAIADERARRFRNPHEETEMLMMRRPLTTERAYTHLGLLLGALSPAAIFYGFAHYGIEGNPDWWNDGWRCALCLAMNLVCAFVGRRVGAKVGRDMAQEFGACWCRYSGAVVLAALYWGILTGAAGGVLFFGIGGFVGAMIAPAVALAALALFAPLHRLLARGGMIDARHFWPVACGITLVIAALILNLGR